MEVGGAEEEGCGGDEDAEGVGEEGGGFGGEVECGGWPVAGEVLVSDTVRSLARTSAGVSFEDRGEHELKGIAESQRVFAVRKESVDSQMD